MESSEFQDELFDSVLEGSFRTACDGLCSGNVWIRDVKNQKLLLTAMRNWAKKKEANLVVVDFFDFPFHEIDRLEVTECRFFKELNKPKSILFVMNFAVLTEEDYENNDQDRNKYEIIRTLFKDRVMGVFSKHITNLLFCIGSTPIGVEPFIDLSLLSTMERFSSEKY